MTSTRDPQEPTLVPDDAAATDDTAGFNQVNTTRSNIKIAASVVSPLGLGLGGGFTPSFESPSLGEHDVAGFMAADAPASEQPADGTADTEDTAGFADPIPGIDVKLGKKPTRIAPAIGFGGGLLPAFESGAQLGPDVVGFVATDPEANASDQAGEDTAGFGLGLLGGPLLPSPATAPPPGEPGGPLINRPPNPLD